MTDKERMIKWLCAMLEETPAPSASRWRRMAWQLLNELRTE